MYVIGVTGGIGSGKSAVLAYLEERYGAFVLRLDDEARALTMQGGGFYPEAVSMLGKEFLRPDGTLDREGVARLIFGDEEAKRRWNARLLPMVRRRTEERLREKRASGVPLFVIESAILLEEKYDAFCNELWYIYADEATRYGRLSSARGYSAERIRRTMAQQLPENRFRARCDVVIDNSGSFDETKRAVDLRMKELERKGSFSGAEDTLE